MSMEIIDNLFWSKVQKRSDDKCWTWLGRRDRDGYGKFNSHHHKWLAHRYAYRYANPEEDIEGKLICHKCDKRNCVNPKHLFSGTTLDNMLDGVKKGRLIRLNEDQVRHIKLLHKQGHSRSYIVNSTSHSSSAVNDILRGHHWTHIVV